MSLCKVRSRVRERCKRCSPPQPTFAQPGLGKGRSWGAVEHTIDGPLILGSTARRKRKGDRAEPQLEEAVAEPGLVVVVALGLCVRDDRDLAIVKPEALVHGAQLRLGGLRIGQED